MSTELNPTTFTDWPNSATTRGCLRRRDGVGLQNARKRTDAP